MLAWPPVSPWPAARRVSVPTARAQPPHRCLVGTLTDGARSMTPKTVNARSCGVRQSLYCSVSVRFESDTVTFKPRADMVLVGRVQTAGGRPIIRLDAIGQDSICQPGLCQKHPWQGSGSRVPVCARQISIALTSLLL